MRLTPAATPGTTPATTPAGTTAGTAGGVGVVIATMNRRSELDRTLTKIEQLPAIDEIVVVDNGSHDGTSAMVRDRHPGVHVVTLTRNIGAAARDIGIRESST